jgi:hypothetical protein
MSIPGVVPLFIDNVWKSLEGTASLRPFINEIDIDKPLTFSSVASRIYGDMSNATVTNRLLFQTSIANSYTALGLLPSGSHDTSVFTIFNNSSPSNSSIGSFSIDTDALSIQSGRIGGGTYLPIKFILGGLERININSSGFLGINESIPEAYLDIKGDIKLQNILLPTNTENKLYAMGNKLFWGNFLLSNLIEDEDVSNITTFSSNKILTVVEDISGELVNYIDTEDNILRQYIDTLAIAVTGQGGGGSAYISGIVGEDVSRGQPVYQKESDGLWYLAQATSTQVSNLSIAVTSGTSGQTINFMRYGNLENLIGLPNSKELYLSQTIAGALTETVPTTGVIVYIGISRGTTNLDVAIGSVGFVPGSGGDTTGSGGPRWSYVLGGM